MAHDRRAAIPYRMATDEGFFDLVEATASYVATRELTSAVLVISENEAYRVMAVRDPKDQSAWRYGIGEIEPAGDLDRSILRELLEEESEDDFVDSN